MELKTKMDNFRGFILGFWEAVVKANWCKKYCLEQQARSRGA